MAVTQLAAPLAAMLAPLRSAPGGKTGNCERLSSVKESYRKESYVCVPSPHCLVEELKNRPRISSCESSCSETDLDVHDRQKRRWPDCMLVHSKPRNTSAKNVGWVEAACEQIHFEKTTIESILFDNAE